MALPVILWFRRDLRLGDHPALHSALRDKAPLLPIFLYSPEEEKEAAPGRASQWWLRRSLAALQQDLRRKGSDLWLGRGPVCETLAGIAQATGATRVVFHRLYDPPLLAQEKQVREELGRRGIAVEALEDGFVAPPGALLTGQGTPFKVFTPFYNRWATHAPPPPLPTPSRLPPWPEGVSPSLDLNNFGLWEAKKPELDLAQHLTPGEGSAARQLDHFLSAALEHYATGRDFPAGEGVSRLSPHLHFGEIGLRRLWAALPHHAPTTAAWTRQLAWREFAAHLLFHFPHTLHHGLNPAFDHFPWRHDEETFEAWRLGQTGYPLVDAAMRQLLFTGWMHNRARMVVASFLVKHLLLPWQQGAAWFWQALADADMANNTLGWQWAAGCGADAAPYFRIFNPIRQGEKFDPQGEYVRRWVPEISSLPNQWIHQPWAAPPLVLSQAGVTLGATYPPPVIGHAQARERALAALAKIKNLNP